MDRLCLACSTDISHRHYHSKRCSECQPKHELKSKVTAKRLRHRAGRRCSVCGADISDLHALRLRCQGCQRKLGAKRARKWRANNPERARWHDRKRKDARAKRHRDRYANDPQYRERIIAKVKKRADMVGTGNRKKRDIDAILERDGTICSLCGNDLGDVFNGSETHVDHIVPVASGGTSDISNRRLLHAHCNLTRGKRIVA